MVDMKYTSPDHLYAMGGSAGGLLMGAVMNQAPELFNGVVAAVPFVDVINTMLDETIPLTTFEFDEWGNPKDSVYYAYMKSYSPYDQVKAQAYPNTLVTTGYWDSQVQYWEPAKWVAKLRELKTDDNTLLFTHQYGCWSRRSVWPFPPVQGGGFGVCLHDGLGRHHGIKRHS